MSYVSTIDCVIIDDSNADQFTENVIVDGAQMAFGWQPPPVDVQSPFCSPFSIPRIDRSEWPERIRDKERSKSTLTAFAAAMGIGVKNQKRTNYCWAFSAVQLVELARALQGLPHVPLSPASVAGPVTRYANAHPRAGQPAGVGGWSTRFIDYAGKHGIASTQKWPEHAIDPRFDNAETQADRQLYVPLEWWQLPQGDFDALATLLLLDMATAIGLPWWRHQVSGLDMVKLDGRDQFGVKIWNPWGPKWGQNGTAVLAENKARPSDAVAVRVMSAA